MKNSKESKKITLFLFLFSLGSILTFITFDILFYSYNVKDKLIKDAVKIAQEKENYLIQSTNNLKNLLRAIEKSNHIKEYMNNPLNHIDDINDLFLLLTEHDKNIMQLRYINKDGFEKIRVDRANLEENPFIVKKENLQNKFSRYYFKDSIKKKNEVWFSDLDLNIEHGKVEVPYKPTLRAMLPLRENGNFNGILIINYHMQKILEYIAKTASYDLIIANENKEYIIHHENKKNWSAYNKKIEYSLKEDFFNNYKKIINNKNNIFKDYVSLKSDLSLPNKLIFIVKMNENYINSLIKDKFIHYLIVGFVIMLLSIFMSIVFSRYLRKLFIIIKDTKTMNRILNKRIERKTQKLFDSKKQLNNLISTISDFIWEVDKNGKYIYLSPQVKGILGYEPSELTNNTPFSVMPEDEVERIKDIFVDCSKNKKPIVQIINKNIHKNGSVVYLETSGNPVFDKDENLIGFRGIDRDVTEKVNSHKIIEENMKKIDLLNKQLELKIDKEIEKNEVKDIQIFAQSKMAAMGDMIANIAHQWRQPLSAISTTASGVKLQYEFEQLDLKKLPKNMDTIVENTQYLSETIDTFREFIKEKKEYRIVGVINVIYKAINIVKTSLDDNHIKLNHNLEELEKFEIETIPSELQQVIINIINNAKDIIKEKYIVDGLINLTLTKHSECLIIKIEDNGGGVPEDIILRIFEPYFTTKHKSQGTGLGLHMVYRIVTESLKGEIYVENSSIGAVFIVKIPFQRNCE